MVESATEREQRAARNQAIVREVNEQLEKLGDGNAPQSFKKFACECADRECIEPVELTVDEYESVRAQGATFVVAPGHVYPDVECVTFETSRFTVVEKLRSASRIARAHDPRARP